MITVSKKIYWKIAHFDKIVETPGQKIQSKWVPINNTRNNRKICDLNLQIYKDSDDDDDEEEDIYFKISSTPVEKSVVLKGNVAFFDAKMKEKLHELNFNLKEYQKGRRIEIKTAYFVQFSTLIDSKERYLAENGVLNVQCEVTSNFIKATILIILTSICYRSKFLSTQSKIIRVLSNKKSSKSPRKLASSVQLCTTTKISRMSSWL